MNASKIQYNLCFETLSNELRVKVLYELQKKPMSVLELSDKLGVEQSRLSHSLEMLKGCHYVNVKADGKQRIYSLRDNIFVNKGGNVFEAMALHAEKHCRDCYKLKRY